MSRGSGQDQQPIDPRRRGHSERAATEDAAGIGADGSSPAAATVLQGRSLRVALESLNEQFSLSEKQTDALGYYAGDSLHQIVNDWLRGRELHKTARELGRAYVHDLDEIFSQAPSLDHPITVYRGINAPEMVTGLEQNGTVDEPGFLSTAIDPDRARSFAEHAGADPAGGQVANGKAVLEIIVPAGTPLLPIHEIVDNLPYGSEEEVLLPRNGSLILDSSDQKTDPPLYRVAYQPD